MNVRETLKYAVENGIIDLLHTQSLVEMKERQQYLDKHPYDIWQSKTNGSWNTYLPDASKKTKRKLIRRTTRESVEQTVVDFWRDEEYNPSVAELYSEWSRKKLSREEISKSTISRYDRQFEQCFKTFGKRKVTSIDEEDVEDFMRDAIHDFNLTQKAFSNLRILVFGIFKLAKKKKLVSFSITQVVNDMEISKKAYRKTVKSDEEAVFMEDEVPVITDYLEENPDMLNLGLLLIFKTGLRIGELCTLKWEDVKGNIIQVSRTEVSYKDDETGEMVYEVQESPKTEAGIRKVILPKRYMWILKKIKLLNPFGTYIFEKDRERIRTYIFRTRLYTICRVNDMVQRSPHKVRRTYASILIDSGTIEDSLIMSQMGHTNIETTKTYYYRNRKKMDSKEKSIENVIGL